VQVAAQVDDGPCVMYIGDGGAGNFVKMVHNGIEYGDMQLISGVCVCGGGCRGACGGGGSGWVILCERGFKQTVGGQGGRWDVLLLQHP